MQNLWWCFLAVFVASQVSYAAENKHGSHRDYANAEPHVKKFYRQQHKYQTVSFVRSQKLQLERTIKEITQATSLEELQELEAQGKVRLMTIWEALLQLDNLIDESDPDATMANSEHAFQTAEAMLIAANGDEQNDWYILVGLLHDIGKVDALLRKNLPQWAVVGDTFPVGCLFSRKNIFYKDFKKNPDFNNPEYNSELGIYKPYHGLNNLLMSYGHDEYAYQVLAAQGKIPVEGLMTIRFHSFYPLHSEGAYKYLMNDENDELYLEWLQNFQKFDLYTKTDEKISRASREILYKKLINKYFPPIGNIEKDGARIVAWPILEDVKL